MNDENLVWQERERKPVYNAKIFTVCESVCLSPHGETGIFSIVETHDWAVVMPIIKTDAGNAFVMVRQWRHGARDLSVEFPGGVIESNEDIEAGARRELREETGFIAEHLVKLGSMNPNPAFMTNRVHVFLAEDLKEQGKQNLDKDEFVSIQVVDEKEVLEQMGKPPYIHALMAVALNFYVQHRARFPIKL